MKWKILQYAMENRESKCRRKRVLAAICSWFSVWNAKREVRILEKKRIYVPENLYTAKEVLEKAKRIQHK